MVFANRPETVICRQAVPGGANGQTALMPDGQLLAGWVASHSFRIVLMRVCHPGPLARRAPTTSGSNRISDLLFGGTFVWTSSSPQS